MGRAIATLVHIESIARHVPVIPLTSQLSDPLSRVGYSALIQYLVNHGYAIYAINNRGSSGYGKTFYYLDDLKHGDVDLGDVVESKRMLIELGQINQHRIGIIGGSYGGYMVLAALAFRPDVFDVGVDIFGVSN
jgi:dipeptidyl aminopeptidase/acylaminoacyl peptidase